MIDALPLGEIGGQQAPLAPTFGHRKDGIEHGPHTQGARASTALSGWDHLFDPLPCLIGQVAWICFFVHIPMLHNPRRLFRQALSTTSLVLWYTYSHTNCSRLTAAVFSLRAIEVV